MKELIEYNDRKIIISSYNVAIERDLVLMAASEENIDPDVYLRVLEHLIRSNKNIYKLYKQEKIFLLYKLRSTSVGNILKLNSKCECGFKFSTEFDLNKIIEVHNIENPELKNIYSLNTEDYFKKDIDDYSFEDYDSLEEYIEENRTKFDFVKTVNCPSCQAKLIVDLASPEIFTQMFSENDIMTLYQSIIRLSFNAKMSLDGIMNTLYPFERGIFADLVNEEIEEINKQRRQQAQNQKR